MSLGVERSFIGSRSSRLRAINLKCTKTNERSLSIFCDFHSIEEISPMIFSHELVEKGSGAVLCSFNGTTSNAEKQKAFQFLEDLKENYPNICLSIASELFKQVNQQSMLHHYALHLIETMIKSKWPMLKPDERNTVKEQLFFIIKTSSINQFFIEPTYIRNSLAKCFIELIKRDCFDKGNTTFDELVNLMQSIAQIQSSSHLVRSSQRSFSPFEQIRTARSWN